MFIFVQYAENSDVHVETIQLLEVMCKHWPSPSDVILLRFRWGWVAIGLKFAMNLSEN